jgi:hypothetical protein
LTGLQGAHTFDQTLFSVCYSESVVRVLLDEINI